MIFVFLFVGIWRLWVIASQPPHLFDIAAEIGSIAQTRVGLFPNRNGSSLIFFQETETGLGTYLCETASGKSHLLFEQKEKGYGNQFRMLGWSPDDSYFAYAVLADPSPTNSLKAIILYNGISGEPMAKIPAEACSPDSQFIWLSTRSFAYSTYTHRSWLIFSQNPDGNWVQTQVVKRFTDGKLINLTVISPHSIAWLKTGDIWTFDFSSGTSEKIWESSTNQLRSFSYAEETGNFLLNCGDEIGPFSIAFRPPTSWDKQGSILNTVRNPVRERYADLDMRHGLYSFALKINTNLVPTTFVWEGMLRYHAIGGDFLFFTGNDVGGAPGIWQYDIKSKTVRSLVSGLQRTLKHSKIVPSLNRAGTNASGKEIGYHLWEPTHVSPGKKYPLILGQSLYVWNSSPQVAANAGYYFATANFTNWINEIDTWPAEVTGLYEILAKNPNIDTNRVFLIAYSAQAGDVGQVLASKPDFCAGLILFHPASWPDLSKTHISKIFLVGGTDDKEDSLPEQLIKFQNDAVSFGTDFHFLLQDGVQHLTRSVATEREQAVQLARFLAGK